MPSLTYIQGGTLITGSSGFLGSHLCDSLPSSARLERMEASVCGPGEMARLARRRHVHTVVHLANRGTVLAPRPAVSAMLDVTVDGTIQLIETFRPARFLFASSCAVYGDSSLAPAPPDWSAVHPKSTFGLSKAMAELVLREWSESGSGHAVILRFGNLTGTGAKGLISYLVRHALQYPDGSVPAAMRGGGTLVRDYLPVDYAIRVMRTALDMRWREPHETFNVGSGCPRSNRDVATVVRDTLRESGIRLRIEFAKSAGFGEPGAAVLDCETTNRRFGLAQPTEEEVVNAIREAVIAQVTAASALNRAAAG